MFYVANDRSPSFIMYRIKEWFDSVFISEKLYKAETGKTVIQVQKRANSISAKKEKNTFAKLDASSNECALHVKHADWPLA